MNPPGDTPFTVSGIRVGVGLPNVLPGTSGDLMRRWAVRAEERGLSFVATVGRLAYPSYDSLISLAVAAGATARIGLLSNVLLAPLVPDTLLAKSSMTLSHLSGGRLTLGVGLGARESDYELTGADFSHRGDVLDRQLDLLHRAWRGEVIAHDQPFGPPDGPIPQVLVGGHSRRAIERVIRFADGWTGANGGLTRNGPPADAVRAAWKKAGRTGVPRLVALVYFGLGEGAEERSRRNLETYYEFFGPERAHSIAAEAARDRATLRAAVREYADAGFTDVVLSPTLADLDQVDRLADFLI